MICVTKMCGSKKYIYSNEGLLFGLYPSRPGIYSLASYLPFKHLAINTPYPLGIFNAHPWRGFEPYTVCADFLPKVVSSFYKIRRLARAVFEL